MNDVVKKIVSESGNSFHCKVANAFREKGWATLMSSYYIDTATDKAREIDLIAEKAYAIPNNFGQSPKSIRVRLYIECKYINQHVVFWFDSRDDKKAREWIYSNTPFTKGNTFTKEHHHLKPDSLVAKLFASESKRNEDNDPIFRALNQCLNGLIHNRRSEPLIPAKGTEQIVHHLNYPVIICSDFKTFYRTDIPKNKNPEKIIGNFLLEVNYAFVDRDKARRDYFLVDLVEYASLDAFFSALDHEVENAMYLLGD